MLTACGLGKWRRYTPDSPLVLLNPSCACLDVVYGRIPATVPIDAAEHKFTIVPRVLPRPGNAPDGETSRSFCARMATDASRVTKNVPVVLMSRNRWNSDSSIEAMSHGPSAPICGYYHGLTLIQYLRTVAHFMGSRSLHADI